MWAALRIFVALFLIIQANATNVYPYDHVTIKDKYSMYEIVPQIIPKPPITVLTDIYGDYIANFGNRIPTCALSNKPFTSWPYPNEHSFYTLIALDLDSKLFYDTAPGNLPLFGLVVNIPGGNVYAGQQLAPYVPPSCFPGLEDKRYLCLVYKQMAPIPVTNAFKSGISSKFGNFSFNTFVMENKLGNPIAGNFYIAGSGSCRTCGNTCGTSNCDSCDASCVC